MFQALFSLLFFSLFSKLYLPGLMHSAIVISTYQLVKTFQRKYAANQMIAPQSKLDSEITNLKVQQ